jgi:hypothetical protein
MTMTLEPKGKLDAEGVLVMYSRFALDDVGGARMAAAGFSLAGADSRGIIPRVGLAARGKRLRCPPSR